LTWRNDINEADNEADMDDIGSSTTTMYGLTRITIQQ
jgi:hypothetical protein